MKRPRAQQEDQDGPRRQLRREDPAAWRPLTMKPGMASAIAVHPSHPFVAAMGLAQPTTGPRTGGAGLDRPVLMAKPKDFAWPEAPTAIPGGDLVATKVSFLLLDGLHLVQEAWAKGQSIEADVVPPTDVEPFIHRNRERQEAAQLNPDVAKHLANAKTYRNTPRSRKDRFALAEAFEALQSNGLATARIDSVLGALGVTHRSRRIAVSSARTWRQFGITPDAANVHDWCIQDIRRDLRAKLRAAKVPHLESVILLAMPAYMKALAGVAARLRQNHLATKAEMSVPRFPARLLLAGAVELGNRIVQFCGEDPENFPFERHARDAAHAAAFHGLHGSWIKAVLKNEAVYASANLFRGYAASVQLEALKHCLASDGWPTQWGARRYRDRLPEEAKIRV